MSFSMKFLLNLQKTYFFFRLQATVPVEFLVDYSMLEDIECHAKNRHNLSQRTFFSSRHALPFPLPHMESLNALFKIIK